MRIDREVRASILALVAFQIVTSVGAIGLLSRLGPAVTRILAENVYSIRAVEEMQATLAARGVVDDATRVRTFTDALRRARGNVTEAGETEHIEAIEQTFEAAIRGGTGPLRATLRHLASLGEINHRSMIRADSRANRLAQAGSWAAVLVGLSALGLSLLVVRRLSSRVVLPVMEVHDAVSAFRHGDPFRRCAVHDAPPELEAVASAVNALLDEHQRASEAPAGHGDAGDRAVLLHLLDREAGPRLVVDAEGRVLAANRSGLDRLSGPSGEAVRAGIEEVVAGRETAARGLVLERVEAEPARWLVALEPDR